MFFGNFPEDLRVLVYAGEIRCLDYYIACLKSNHYKVITPSINENQVMSLLCEHKHLFDIALMDVTKSDGSIFQLISKIDLPIIIISEDKSVESVTKWITNGACDYLVKPLLKPEDLELIYKYVLRAGKKSVVVTGEKVSDEEKSSDRASASTSKKRRIVWDKPLHKSFCDAVNSLGDKAVPKSILDHMKVEYLTRDHVASHLQKYRLNEKKKKKKKEPTIPEERLEANHEEVPIAIDKDSGIANDQQHGKHQTTTITTQPRSDNDIIGHDAEWFYNQSLFGIDIDSIFHTNVG